MLEAGPAAGRGAANHEFAPGYHVSGLAHILNMPDPHVVKAMALKRHGLKFAKTNLASTALATVTVLVVDIGVILAGILLQRAENRRENDLQTAIQNND